ncbi:Sugar phosphate isomerase/epimerase [Singulisphaera sp. GP187]|nr:Sugar phosphate isomerase/epimerase [Singulisphaera sp. GP187]
MSSSTGVSRRGLVRLGASAALLAPLAGLAPRVVAAAGEAESAKVGDDPWLGLKVGVASYSLSKLALDDAIKGIRRVGVNYVSIKDSHLSLKSTAEQRQAVVRKFRDAGITPLSCGVVGLNDDEASLRNAFEYARDAGIPTIVCKPTRQSLAQLDKLVKEFNIRLAIHNHGPEDKVWPSPLDAWEAVQPFDERIGVCIDVGHTARCGVDPAVAIRKCAPRLYDLHFKDLSSREGKSKPVVVGWGVLDTLAMLRALLEIKYPYHVGLEYEADMNDPLPGVAESIGYVRGALAGLKHAGA